MKLNDSWQDMFSSRVLSKGYDYYLSDSIHNVRKSGDGYEAKIRGSYEYDVYVNIKDGKLIDADCSCPYASDGNFCKHEAALLYYLEDGGCVEEEDAICFDEIAGILDSLSKNEMKKILLSLASEEQSVRERLYGYSPKLSPMQKKDLIMEARSYFSCMDDAGYYNEYEISRAISGFSGFFRGNNSSAVGGKTFV